MMRFRVLLPLFLLAACTTPARSPVSAPPPPPTTVTPPPPPPVVTPSAPPPNAAFATWLAHYRKHAISRGASPAAVDTLLSGVELNTRVLALDRWQPGDSGSAAARFDAYLARQVDSARINLGVAAANRMSTTLASVQARTGVPGEILVAIWGLESGYGKVTGNFDVPSSLATLAWDGRRAALFTTELDATLTIIEKGLAPREALRGSWAGAMGQPQFLPSSFLAHGDRWRWRWPRRYLGQRSRYVDVDRQLFQAEGLAARPVLGLPVTVPDRLRPRCHPQPGKAENLRAPARKAQPLVAGGRMEGDGADRRGRLSRR